MCQLWYIALINLQLKGHLCENLYTRTQLKQKIFSSYGTKEQQTDLA